MSLFVNLKLVLHLFLVFLSLPLSIFFACWVANAFSVLFFVGVSFKQGLLKHLFLKYDRNEVKIKNQMKLTELAVVTAIFVMSLFRSSKLYNVALQGCSVIQQYCLLALFFCRPILAEDFARWSA